MADTAKSWPLGKAPKRIELLGDRKRPESAQHIIEFPGGAIEVSRTSDNEYWAHIIVNHGWDGGDGSGLSSARGDVVIGRVDRDYPDGVCDIERPETVTQVAVLIRTSKGGGA